MSRWYIIHAYSGFENKVRDAIKSEATRLGLDPVRRAGRGPDREGHRGPPRQEDHVGAQVLPRLRARQAGDERRRLPPRQEHAEGDRLPRPRAASRSRSPTPRRRACSTPRTKPPPPRPRPRSASIMRSATRQGARRPLRQLQRPGRGARFRPRPGQGRRLDLRPRDAGGAGVRAGRTREMTAPTGRHPRESGDPAQ